MQVENTPDASAYKGEFFSVSIGALDEIAGQSESADAVLSYLVLARHAKGHGAGAKCWTAAGATAIQNKSGVSYRYAKQALGWLSSNDSATMKQTFILPADKARQFTAVPEHFGSGKGNATRIRWCLQEFNEPVYLANALIDGIGKGISNPPLARLYSDVTPDFENGVTMAKARLDVVMLLVHLYRYHDIERCGGIDPRSGIYRSWKLSDTASDFREPVTAIDGTNAALYEVEGAHQVMWLSLAQESFSYVLDAEERKSRFWCAFNNLFRFGFLYEVLTIWSGDPTDEKTGKNAEYLYPLYIFDKKRRDKEPYLQREIHTLAINKGAMDAPEIWDTYSRGEVLGSGKFRFVGNKKVGAYPVGIFRLKFRPKTRDTGKGMAAEEAKALTWTNALRKLYGRRELSQWPIESS